MKSGSNQPSTILPPFSDDMSQNVNVFLLILKRLGIASLALGSLPLAKLPLLFRSMTHAQQQAAIGTLQALNVELGILLEECLKTQPSPNSSKTAPTTSSSSGDQ